MNGLFPYGTFAHWVGGSGFVLSIWLGAYLATHVPRRVHARLAYISIFVLAGYFLYVTLCLFLPAEEAGYLWRRYLGWLSLGPLPIWLHLSHSLQPTAQQRRQRPLIWIAYAAGVSLSAIWILGDWSFSRETLFPPMDRA